MGISEVDASLSAQELEELWLKHQKGSRMRGEEPLSFEAWRRRRARGELEVFGRGLWCKTNMDDIFDKEVGRRDQPPDDQLPNLTPPDVMSAFSKSPNVQVVNVTDWARSVLK